LPSLQVLSADSAVLSSDNEVEGFLTAHLKKLREIRQLVGMSQSDENVHTCVRCFKTDSFEYCLRPASRESIDFVSVIEQNYGGWVGWVLFYYIFSKYAF